jgi:hypothetical protein
MGNCNNSCIDLLRKKKECNLEELDKSFRANTIVNDPEILSNNNLN